MQNLQHHLYYLTVTEWKNKNFISCVTIKSKNANAILDDSTVFRLRDNDKENDLEFKVSFFPMGKRNHDFIGWDMKEYHQRHHCLFITEDEFSKLSDVADLSRVSDYSRIFLSICAWPKNHDDGFGYYSWPRMLCEVDFSTIKTKNGRLYADVKAILHSEKYVRKNVDLTKYLLLGILK